MPLFGCTIQFNLIQNMYTFRKIYQINILNYEYVDTGELFSICLTYSVLMSIFGLVSSNFFFFQNSKQRFKLFIAKYFEYQHSEIKWFTEII